MAVEKCSTHRHTNIQRCTLHDSIKVTCVRYFRVYDTQFQELEHHKVQTEKKNVNKTNTSLYNTHTHNPKILSFVVLLCQMQYIY